MTSQSGHYSKDTFGKSQGGAAVRIGIVGHFGSDGGEGGGYEHRILATYHRELGVAKNQTRRG